MHPRNRLPQTPFILSSISLRTHHNECKCSCTPLICREYLRAVDVSSEFPGNNAFHELSYGVLLCEDAASIQFVWSFSGFRMLYREAYVGSIFDILMEMYTSKKL